MDRDARTRVQSTAIPHRTVGLEQGNRPAIETGGRYSLPAKSRRVNPYSATTAVTVVVKER